jgi:AraC-like DNA-binding protein
MICRCKHPVTHNYDSYGGRGVSVCERWLKFENFYADMGDRPDGCSLGRIDNDGDYSPDNCYWANNYDQQRNKRSNVTLLWEDRRWVLTDLCKHLGIYSTHLYRNMKRGLSLEGAINHLVHLKEKRNAKIVTA